MITVGIDVGSISTKAALIRDDRLMGTTVILTGGNAKNAAKIVFHTLLADLELPPEAVDRIVAMARHVGLTDPVMMTGGVAKNIGVVRALEKKSGTSIHVPHHAQANGAIGAALIAAGAGTPV